MSSIPQELPERHQDQGIEYAITDDINDLLAVLPPHIAERIATVGSQSDLGALVEIVMDLGRRPEARFQHDEIDLLDVDVTREDLSFVGDRIGSFGEDNRAGIERTLHRISAIRNRSGEIVGLTCRIGRAVYGTIAMIRDLIESGESVLLLGRPGVGKTTILNALSGAGRSTKDRLFETLETTTRLVEGSGKNGRDGARPDFVVPDTVGFIRKLPTQLVHSFASTLSAARDADMVILCADASSVELEDEVHTVRRTLAGGSVGAAKDGAARDGAARGTEEEVASGTAPVLCLNKMDLVSEKRARELTREFPDAVRISALIGCEPLLEEVYRRIADQRERMQVLIPHSEYGAASRLYGLAEIHAQRNTTTGLWLDVSLPRSASARYRPYKVA